MNLVSFNENTTTYGVRFSSVRCYKNTTIKTLKYSYGIVASHSNMSTGLLGIYSEVLLLDYL